jgi:hypothetical protein
MTSGAGRGSARTTRRHGQLEPWAICCEHSVSYFVWVTGLKAKGALKATDLDVLLSVSMTEVAQDYLRIVDWQ